MDGIGRRIRSWLRSRRAASAGVLAVLLVASLAALAHGKGYRNSRLVLSGGGAWLASASQGLVTLIDGASEQVVGSVRAPGAGRGDALGVVQSGPSAYVVNRTQGTVSRVDGGTYEVSEPVRFGEGGGTSLEVFAGGPSLYIVDGGRRVASVTDPVSLRVRDRLSMAAQPGENQSIVDAAGRLWVIDREKGGLTWFDGTKRVRPDAADPDTRLLLVQGRPVLVDPGRSRLGLLSTTGRVGEWSCLEVRAGDKAQLLGSASSARVFAAMSATGTLVASAVGRDDCRISVEVGRSGDDFGPLVETAGFVFVPNRTSGRTLVVDMAAGRVAASLEVVKPGSRLELLAKDGFVFYNDVDGDQAGVIRLDGGQWKLGRALKKYKVSNTGDGILTAGGDNAKPEQPPTNVPGQKPGGANKPDEGGNNVPRPPISQPDPGSGNPPPGGGNPPPPGGGDPPPGGSPSPNPGRPPVITDITWTPDPPVRGKQVTFAGTATNADGATWKWTLARPNGSTVHTSSEPNGFSFPLQASHGPTLTIKLELTGPGGAATPVTKTVQTTADPTPQISNLLASDTTPGVGQKVTFTAEEPVGGAQGTWVWQVTDPSGQDMSGPQQQPGLQPFEYAAWEAIGTHQVKLTVTFNGKTDSATVLVNVVDQCKMVPATQGPIDLRRGGNKQVSVRLQNCFVTQDITVGTQGTWLNVSQRDIQIAPNGTGTITVSDNGNGGADGDNMDALHFSRGLGNQIVYNVQINRPPKILPSGDGSMSEYTVCVPAGNQVQFLASYQDADLDTLDVALTVNNITIHLKNGSQVPSLFAEFLAKSQLPPTVTTWTVQATDQFGAKSKVTVGTDRWNCW